MDLRDIIEDAEKFLEKANLAVDSGNNELCHTTLCDLKALLTDEIPSEAPAEPKTPAEPSEG